MADTSDRTFLGIDYGSRRIGVAKSDATGLIASPVTTVEVRSKAQASSAILALIEEHRPVGLVVGYPLYESGDVSAKCREVDGFIAHLRKEGYSGPIYREDEAHSSSEAMDILHAHGKRVGQNKKRIDRLAAVVILQRFLDEKAADNTTTES